MTKAIALFALLTSCAHIKSYDGYPVPTTKEDCMQLFRDIQEIQSTRRALMNEMSQATQTFEDGRMSRARFQKKREAWLESDGHHRRNVTFLYDIGYEYGCF